MGGEPVLELATNCALIGESAKYHRAPEHEDSQFAIRLPVAQVSPMAKSVGICEDDDSKGIRRLLQRDFSPAKSLRIDRILVELDSRVWLAEKNVIARSSKQRIGIVLEQVGWPHILFGEEFDVIEGSVEHL